VATLDEENVAEALRDVRTSLLEADVDLAVVRGFLEQVKQRALGREVAIRGGKRHQRMKVSAGDHFTRACYEELVATMGTAAPLEVSRKLRTILLLGLQGTGKTSTAAKLARHLAEKGEKPLLVAADVHRPAAREQLRVLGEQIGVEVFTLDGTDAPAIVDAALAHAREARCHSVIVDTAGRLQIDETLMDELSAVHARAKPEHSILVCDAMAGREAVNVARGFAERLPIDGLILSKLDGDARGGAALAIRQVTGVPVRYVTTGEGTDRIELFRPEGMATRILGMGDVVSLMDSFEKIVDEEKAEEEAKRLLKGTFTFDDFLSQLRAIKKMGSVRELLAKLPFAGDLMASGMQVDDAAFGRFESMILSMTAKERKTPDLIDASRRARIARGAGSSLTQVDEMLARFGAMRGAMAQLGKAGGMQALGGLMAGGGGTGPLDPEAAQRMGMGAQNRAMARAMRAQSRKKGSAKRKPKSKSKPKPKGKRRR
jgi:signal recognition particle subunit SRP54